MPQSPRPHYSDVPADEWIPVAAAAELAHVHLETVRRWIRAGHLAADQSLSVRKTRVRTADVLRLAEEGPSFGASAPGTEQPSVDVPEREAPSQIATPGRRVSVIDG
jgi:hypothetical protein